jgi:hypothetical protein
MKQWSVANTLFFGIVLGVTPALVCGQDFVRPMAFDYDYYARSYQPSPSDLPATSPPEEAATPTEVCHGATLSCCPCDACQPWRLLPTLPGGFQCYGWLNGGAALNADSPASRFNGPVTLADRDELMLNQSYIVLERSAEPFLGPIDLGARLDLLFGTDYFFTEAAGLERDRVGTPKWNNRRFYGLALPQMYLDFVWNDLSVKVGHFYTLLGYESVMAPANFFYTHSYAFQYGRPFTHTGVLTTYRWTDRLVLYNGIHNGWDAFDRPSERAAYLGGARWTNDAGNLWISYFITAGQEFNVLNVYTNRTAYSLIAGWQINDCWQYVIDHTAGWQDRFTLNGDDVEWYGLAQYLFYTVNECWKFGLRFEWFRDDDGVRVGSNTRLTNPVTGGSFVGNFYDISLGLNWTPTSNFAVRPELRWDWYTGPGPSPYDDGTKDHQFLGAVDLIWQF